MRHEWSRRKEKGRMDWRVLCSERCIRKREKMGNKRLGELLAWQAIHSSNRKEDLRLVNRRVKTGK